MVRTEQQVQSHIQAAGTTLRDRLAENPPTICCSS